MDFDLFELDDDDEILSSICIEPTQHTPSIDVIHEFECMGEDVSKASQFASKGFVRNDFVSLLDPIEPRRNKAMDAITWTDYAFEVDQLYHESVEQYVFREACRNVQYLVANVRDGSVERCDVEPNYYHRRNQVTLLLHLIVSRARTSERWPHVHAHLTMLRDLLHSIADASMWKLIYNANSANGNNCPLPAYQLLHGLLEWKLLDLCALFQSANSSASSQINAADVISQIEELFGDLIDCSLFHFAKKHPIQVLYSSPFPCACFKEMWLMLLVLLTRTRHSLNAQFWPLYNGVMLRRKENLELFAIDEVDYWLFTNWMTVTVGTLFGYRSNGAFEGPRYAQSIADDVVANYVLIEQCTQRFLSAQPNEEQLRVYIGLLEPTLVQWWRPRATVVQLLWEHFHRHLNASFYVAGAVPATLAVTHAQGRDYVEQCRRLLDCERCDPRTVAANACGSSSYTLFVLLAGKTLRRLLSGQLENQAHKLLGRIHSKFSAQKFLALSERGLHHLTELFVVLALSGDFDDLAPKLRDHLLSIALEKVSSSVQQVAVTKGHMALLWLFVEHRRDVGVYARKLLAQLAAIHSDLAVSKVIADALPHIFEHPATSCASGESLLIDAWLPNYLNHCTANQRQRCLGALHAIFEKMQQRQQQQQQQPNEQQHGDMMKALNNHLLPFIKQHYATDSSRHSSQLAADFCKVQQHADTFDSLFAFFVETPTASCESLARFILHVLASDRRRWIADAIIMQAWLKCVVLLAATNEHVLALTQQVAALPLFASTTHLNAGDLLAAKEPLCVFIAALGQSYDRNTDHQHRRHLTDVLNSSLLKHFERWLPPDTVLGGETTTTTTATSTTGFRFYSFIAIVVFNCAPMVYVKSKITCFFHVAMTRFILPTSIQMGRAPDPKLAQLVHRVWPVLVQGIGRLNFKGDAYVTKTLTDLIHKWTPHFRISPQARIVARPFVACLQGDNAELSLFLFEKLAQFFLTTQRRQADVNACLIVTIFQEVVDDIVSKGDGDGGDDDDDDAITNSARHLQTFLKGTSLVTLEHVMMVDETTPSRTLLLQLLRRILVSRTFRRCAATQDLFAEHLRIITRSHLAYYTFFYFEAMTKIAHFAPDTVAAIMNFLLDEVRVVEEKRGGGEDNVMRTCLAKLQLTVESSNGERLGRPAATARPPISE